MKPDIDHSSFTRLEPAPLAVVKERCNVKGVFLAPKQRGELDDIWIAQHGAVILESDVLSGAISVVAAAGHLDGEPVNIALLITYADGASLLITNTAAADRFIAARSWTPVPR